MSEARFSGLLRIYVLPSTKVQTLTLERWLEVRVSEARFSGGLRIYVQEGGPPSLISHLTQDISTSFNIGLVCRAGALPGCVSSAKSEGYFYTAPVYAGKDYYIGTKFTCFASTDVQILTPVYAGKDHYIGTSCFTS